MSAKEIPPINLKLLQTYAHLMMRRGVGYKMGAKARTLSVPPTAIYRIDCSGFFRWIVYNSTAPRLLIPDGSWNQRAWCEDRLPRVDYRRVYDDPGKLYAAFMNPLPGVAGHVWWVNDRETFESHGGIGVDSRPWNHRPLPQEVDYCFVWPHVWV